MAEIVPRCKHRDKLNGSSSEQRGLKLACCDSREITCWQELWLFSRHNCMHIGRYIACNTVAELFVTSTSVQCLDPRFKRASRQRAEIVQMASRRTETSAATEEKMAETGDPCVSFYQKATSSLPRHHVCVLSMLFLWEHSLGYR